MSTETPIIVVIYLEVGNLRNADLSAYISHAAKVFNFEQAGHKIIQCLIPTNGQPHSRIECINPKLVGEEEYGKALAVVDRMETAMAEFLKNAPQPEEPELPLAHSDR